MCISEEKSNIPTGSLSSKKTNPYRLFRSKSKVHKLLDPKNKKEFWIILASELVSTWLLTLLLLILDSIHIKEESLLNFLSFNNLAKSNDKVFTQIVLCFYVFFVVGFVILLFERWSCNANPTISFYLYVSGNCSGIFTFYKILVQFIGAILAGAIALGLALLSHGIDFSSISSGMNPLGGFQANSIASFGTEGTIWQFISAQGTAFFVEFAAAIGICFTLLSSGIKKNVKFISIILFFGVGIATASTSGVVGFNPARSFGPTLFHDIFILTHGGTLNIYNSQLATYWAFLIGPFMGVLAYFGLSRVYVLHIAPLVAKIALSK